MYETDGTNILNETEVIAAIRVVVDGGDHGCRRRKRSICVILRTISLPQRQGNMQKTHL